MSATIWNGTALLMLAAALAGCGGEDDPWPRAAVSGQVTLDGAPLASGTITFFPSGTTKGPAAGGEIVAGKFSIPARTGPVVGTNRIEVRSVQKTGRMVESPSAVEADGPATEGMLVEEYADIVPQRYNTYSELERTIEPDIENLFDLRLESQGGPASTSAP
jgi:hypothetical protein